MKTTFVTVILLFGLAPGVAFGAQVDSRFDGRWVGVETFQINDGLFEFAEKIPQYTTMVVIADSGQTFGIMAGFAPGRYIISDKSHGKSITIKSARRICTFTLSDNGNTLKEMGHVAIYFEGAGLRGCEVWATFHRAGK